MKRLVTALLCLTFANFIFVGCGNDDPTNYTITATADENGTITPSGDVTVEENGTQQFTIAANSGYEIDQVLIDGTNNTEAVDNGGYTFSNVTANHTIAASFKAISGTNYTITATAGDNGTITPNGAVNVNENGSQLFTITPNSGYEIDQVLINGTNNTEAVSNGSYTFTNVTDNHTIAASFKAVSASSNFWRIGDTEYALTAGEILYWGNAYNDNSSDMYLLLETGTLRFDEDEFWFTGKGNYLHLEIISSPAGLSSGTYNYVDNSAFTADDYTNGMLIEPEYVLNVDEANEEFYLITGGGQVTITVTGDIYKITFTLIDENGVSHTGHYEGPLSFHDFS